MPYFVDWRKSERVAWPMGGGRAMYPLRLSMAFDTLDSLVSDYMDKK